MAIKFSLNVEEQKQEIKILLAARKLQKVHPLITEGGPIPEILSTGVFEYSFGGITPLRVSFMIMKKYAINLLDYLEIQENV